MKKITTLIIVSLTVINAIGQTVNSRGPYQWPNNRNNIASIQLPSVDVVPLLKEDAENEKLKIGPWRFGKNFDTNYSINNSGSWTTLPNNDRLWEIGINGTNALSLNFIFEEFNLPVGAELYIYSPTSGQKIGAYTTLNNSNSGILGSELIMGNEANIQLYVPANASFEPTLTIATITHGYKNVGGYANQLTRALNDSEDCNVDVNCPLGDGWEKQIRAVAMIVVNGNGACTGTLINNTKEDGTPYFLTANHCGTNVANWAFRFNWESPTPSCATTVGSGPDNDYNTMNGATLIANNNKSDVNLIKFNNDIPLDFNVYYAGWDKSDVMSGPATGIHHPSGDIKKICRENETVHFATIDFNGNTTTQMWQIDDWDQGVTEPGSSGSALFDSKGRIIGQLAGGYAACNGTTDNNTEDWYGRFGVSWDYGSTPETRLKDWLDPNNINVDTLNGFDPNEALHANDLRIASVAGVKPNMCEPSLSDQISPIVTVINQGFDTIQSFSLYFRVDNLALDSLLFSGQNLAPYASLNLALPSYDKTVGAHTLLTYTANPNNMPDEKNSNDTLKVSYDIAVGQALFFNLTLDYYTEETSWSIKTDEGITIDSGSNYTSQITINNDYCLQDDCYVFEIEDSGDNGLSGIISVYFTGTFSAQNADGDTIFSLHPDSLNFGSSTSRNFCLPETLGISDNIGSVGMNVYPNPTYGEVNITTNSIETKQVFVYNVIGQQLSSTETNEETLKIDLSNYLEGTYLIKIKLNEVIRLFKVQKTSR